MHIDVLAVNCRVEGTTLHCGALYLSPRIAHQIIRLVHEGGSIDLELPPHMLNSQDAYRAWSVSLPIKNEQVHEPAVRP